MGTPGGLGTTDSAEKPVETAMPSYELREVESHLCSTSFPILRDQFAITRGLRD